MIAVFLPIAIASVAVAAVLGGYLIQYGDESVKSQRAAEVVEKARLLKRLSNFDSSSRSSASLVAGYQMPFSSLIVQDANMTKEMVNLLSKQYEAVTVLLESDPNFSAVDNCVLMASTKKISETECELVKDKTFRAYSLENGAVSFDIDSDDKVLSHVKTIEANYANLAQDSVSISEENNVSSFSLNQASESSVRNLRREFLKEEKIIKSIDSSLNSGDFAVAASYAKNLASTTKNTTLAKLQLDRVASEVLSTPSGDVNYDTRVEMAKAYLVAGAVDVVEKTNLTTGVSSSLLAESESMTAILSENNISNATNTYITSDLQTKVVSYFGH
ncbi:MAG: hypothetical protein PHO62_07960 [Sulfurimonas sp.]|uniref:hypothetical protein n=1 Tax=Sulfurimonas sp. TaxID=2022749 RepID=UPI002638D23C|nr:hypothetical protein [Sulfurimonas sp.]MDD5373342.1 hypothetical protein [Sulfurimonas sp.]